MPDLRRELRAHLAGVVRTVRRLDDAQAIDLVECTMRTFAADQLRICCAGLSAGAIRALEERATWLENRMDGDLS